jgi:hypothetical protein
MDFFYLEKNPSLNSHLFVVLQNPRFYTIIKEKPTQNYLINLTQSRRTFKKIQTEFQQKKLIESLL